MLKVRKDRLRLTRFLSSLLNKITIHTTHQIPMQGQQEHTSRDHQIMGLQEHMRRQKNLVTLEILASFRKVMAFSRKGTTVVLSLVEVVDEWEVVDTLRVIILIEDNSGATVVVSLYVK